MTTTYILDSLQYNIANEKIKSKETAKKYLTSIGMLVDYILAKSSIKNISLKNELGAPSRWEDSSYRSQCNRFVESCVNLRDKEIFSAIEYDMAEQLIEWCDIQIRNAIEGENLFGRSALFRKMVAGLCVKLMLLTGVTYRCVRQLKMEALDLDANTITISNYTIRLPIIFSKQIREYAIIRENNSINGEFLFVNAKGKQWKDQTASSGIPAYWCLLVLIGVCLVFKVTTSYEKLHQDNGNTRSRVGSGRLLYTIKKIQKRKKQRWYNYCWLSFIWLLSALAYRMRCWVRRGLPCIRNSGCLFLMRELFP